MNQIVNNNQEKLVLTEQETLKQVVNGEPNEEEKPYICRSQAKNGTCSFYGYATLYVIKKGKRITLGIRAMRSKETCILYFNPFIIRII